MSHDSVSVVIPCYNGEAFLHDAIASVLAQSYAVKEVIVVDDGSLDRSAKIANGFGKPVHLIQQKNQGESVARNQGIRHGTGDWIAFLDADDVWQPDKIEKQFAALDQAIIPHEIVCIYSDYYRFCGAARFGHFKVPDPGREDRYVQGLTSVTANCCTAMVRAAVAKKVLFPESTRSSEDIIFFTELLSHGEFLRVPQPLSGYRMSDNQQTASPVHAILSAQSRIDWARSRLDLFDQAAVGRVAQSLAKSLRWRLRESCWGAETYVIQQGLETLQSLDGGLPSDLRLRDSTLYRFGNLVYFRLYRWAERHLTSLLTGISRMRRRR